MQRVYAGRKFRLMTATRSDSHEDDETFLRDISANLDMLESGGVLVTDGIRASFSRRHRIEGIATILRRRSDVRCHVVVDRATNAVVTLVFQRLHPDGYLSEEEMGVCFDLDCHALVPVSRVLSDPFTRISAEVRMRVLRSTGNRVDIFRGVQSHLVRTILGVLEEEGLRMLVEQDGFFHILRDVSDLAAAHANIVRAFLREGVGRDGVVDIEVVARYRGEHTQLASLWEALECYPDVLILLSRYTDSKAPFRIEDMEIAAYIHETTSTNLRAMLGDHMRFGTIAPEVMSRVTERVTQSISRSIEDSGHTGQSDDMQGNASFHAERLFRDPDLLYLIPRHNPTEVGFPVSPSPNRASFVSPTSIPDNAQF